MSARIARVELRAAQLRNTRQKAIDVVQIDIGRQRDYIQHASQRRVVDRDNLNLFVCHRERHVGGEEERPPQRRLTSAKHQRRRPRRIGRHNAGRTRKRRDVRKLRRQHVIDIDICLVKQQHAATARHRFGIERHDVHRHHDVLVVHCNLRETGTTQLHATLLDGHFAGKATRLTAAATDKSTEARGKANLGAVCGAIVVQTSVVCIGRNKQPHIVVVVVENARVERNGGSAKQLIHWREDRLHSGRLVMLAQYRVDYANDRYRSHRTARSRRRARQTKGKIVVVIRAVEKHNRL